MAIVTIVAATQSAVTSAEFTVTGPFILYGELFGIGESAVLQQEISTDVWRDATDQHGSVGVSNTPNTMYWDGFGTFRIRKSITQASAIVSYEEQ